MEVLVYFQQFGLVRIAVPVARRIGFAFRMNANEIQDLIVRGGVHHHSAVRSIPDAELTCLLYKPACGWILLGDLSLHHESKSTFARSKWLNVASGYVGAGDGVDSICADDHVSGDFRTIFQSKRCCRCVNIDD